MQYKTYGDIKNPAFIILHGWGSKENSWDEVGKLLSNKYFVIIPKIPCALKNYNCNKTYNLDDYAIIVKELIEKLNLKNFILFGHSNGGAIAIKLLVNFPDLKVKKLILNNTAGIRKDIKRNLKRNILTFISKILKPIFSWSYMGKLRVLFYKLIGGQDYIEAEKNPNIKQTYLNMINEDLQNLISKIKKETLLIWGENDTYTPLSDAKKINKFIKNSKLTIIKNARHGIHLQKPKDLVKVILDNN